jgi:hypothetical protein
VVHAAAHVDEIGVEASGVAGEADAESGELVGGQRGGPVVARAGLAPGVVGDGAHDGAGLVGDDVRGAEVIVVERFDGIDPAARDSLCSVGSFLRGSLEEGNRCI